MTKQTDTVQQELFLKNERVSTPTVSRGRIGWLRGLFDETSFGIRRNTEKMVEYREYFEETTKTAESLRCLNEIDERLRRESAKAALDHEIEIKERAIKLESLEYERALLKDEHEIALAKRRDEKEKIERGNRSRSQQKHESAVERKLREMRTQAEEVMGVGRLAAGLHKQQIAELDEDVKSEKLSAAAAEHIKRQLKLIYERGSMQP